MNREPEKNQGPQSERWREIQGENNWKGLVDPMDPLLRREIIHSFNFNTYCKYCGTCNYPMNSFFRALGMDHFGYEMSRYLYATSSSNLRRFFRKSLRVQPGARKRLDRRRDIVFAWRDTVTYLEWVEDLKINQVKPKFGPDDKVRVESGFLDLYNSKEPACNYCSPVISKTRCLMERCKAEGNELSITITGHSLGGTLAILSAYDIAETGLNVLPDGPCVPITVFTFGSPRVEVRSKIFNITLFIIHGLKREYIHNVTSIQW
ncbi:hypothetical protein AMTRI_Chr01g104580 [Amborella trichopoda]